MIPCATCGAPPIGTFNDGSPRYGPSCLHDSLPAGSPVHPAYLAAVAIAAGRTTQVRLDEPDQKAAETVAKRVADRYREGKDATMKYRSRSIADVNRDGFGAELAVARWLDLEWHRGNRRKTDVGDDIEVRNVRRADGLLALYTYDHASRRFVLVTGSFPSYTIRGWLPGKDAMTERYWHPKGAVVAGYALDVARFLVPQDDLRSPFELLDAVSEASAT